MRRVWFVVSLAPLEGGSSEVFLPVRESSLSSRHPFRLLEGHHHNVRYRGKFGGAAGVKSDVQLDVVERKYGAVLKGASPRKTAPAPSFYSYKYPNFNRRIRPSSSIGKIVKNNLLLN